jgi:hypothetical protein
LEEKECEQPLMSSYLKHEGNARASFANAKNGRLQNLQNL